MVPGDANSLAVIRWVITRLALTLGLKPDEVDQIEVAVDEACSNVLDHAYRTLSPKPPLHLEIHLKDTDFIVDIIDQGHSFDYTSYIPPKFPDHWIEGHERGVGLYIIRQFMDEVHYESLPDKRNRMRLIKKVQRAALPQLASVSA